MSAFFLYFPDVAKEQTRIVVVDNGSRGVSPGRYSFLELYCSKKGCDCRNVMINVYERRGGHLATINHALDPGGFKDLGLPRTFLDLFNKQSKEAEGLLKLFKEQLRDRTFAQQLEQHYIQDDEAANRQWQIPGVFL